MFEVHQKGLRMISDAPRTVQVIDTANVNKSLALIDGQGSARVVLWPGNGARFRTMQILDLAAHDRTIDLGHSNDCVYYVVLGAGWVRDLQKMSAEPLVEGSMVHIDAGDRYRLEAGSGGMRVVGGPVPADPALYSSLGDEAAQ
jgi:hypothetical protein